MRQSYVIAYGGKTPPVLPVATLTADPRLAEQHGVFVAEPGRTPALRFNSDRGVRYGPNVLTELPDTASKLARLKSDCARSLDLFARNRLRFLDLYFEFVEAQVAAASAALDQALAWSDGVLRRSDWVFSALRPLPDALIGFTGPDPDDAPLRHDFVFWTGDTVLAVRLVGVATGSAAARAAQDRLTDRGVQIVAVPAAALTDGIALFDAPDFPPALRDFWSNQCYPSSPFRPLGLADLPTE